MDWKSPVPARSPAVLGSRHSGQITASETQDILERKTLFVRVIDHAKSRQLSAFAELVQIELSLIARIAGCHIIGRTSATRVAHAAIGHSRRISRIPAGSCGRLSENAFFRSFLMVRLIVFWLFPSSNPVYWAWSISCRRPAPCRWHRRAGSCSRSSDRCRRILCHPPALFLRILHSPLYCRSYRLPLRAVSSGDLRLPHPVLS